MERYLFLGCVLDALARGSTFRSYFARFLKIAAAVIAFTGLVVLLDAWKFTSRQEAAGIVGGIAFMFCLAAGFYMVVHAAIIRAGHIAALPDSEFPLIPLCAVVFLLAGEAYAAFSTSVSLGGGVLIWFTPNSAFEALRKFSAFVPHPVGEDFLSGLLLMIRGLVRAAVALAGGYLASELLLVIGKMAERGPGGDAIKDQGA
jgi:hypothetical protein